MLSSKPHPSRCRKPCRRKKGQKEWKRRMGSRAEESSFCCTHECTADVVSWMGFIADGEGFHETSPPHTPSRKRSGNRWMLEEKEFGPLEVVEPLEDFLFFSKELPIGDYTGNPTLYQWSKNQTKQSMQIWWGDNRRRVIFLMVEEGGRKRVNGGLGSECIVHMYKSVKIYKPTIQP